MREKGGPEAKAALAALIDGKEVRCELVDASPTKKGFQRTDPYGRPVAKCSAGGRDLGQALLAQGQARTWP